MTAAGLLAIPIVCIIPLLASAEDGSVGSEEAFQVVCERAMPFLLQRDFANGFDVLKVACNSDGIKMLDEKPVQNSSEFHNLGAPVDWKFVGTKSVGGGLRQYLYLCRYEHQIMTWSFIAFELNERWILLGFRFEGREEQVFADFAALPDADIPAECQTVIDDVIEQMTRGGEDAVQNIVQHLVHPQRPNIANQQLFIRRVVADAWQWGSPPEREIVYTKHVGEDLIECCYSLQWQQTMRFLRIYCYRPADEWKLLSFQYDPDWNSILSRVTVKPAGPLHQAAVPRSEGKQ